MCSARGFARCACRAVSRCGCCSSARRALLLAPQALPLGCPPVSEGKRGAARGAPTCPQRWHQTGRAPGGWGRSPVMLRANEAGRRRWLGWRGACDAAGAGSVPTVRPAGRAQTSPEGGGQEHQWKECAGDATAPASDHQAAGQSGGRRARDARMRKHSGGASGGGR